MHKVTKAAISQLLEHEDTVTVSLFMPTHRFPTSEHITEDKIRFRNLIRGAKDALAGLGAEDEVSAQIIDVLETTMYESDVFWQETTEGLAVFASPAGVWYFHLPMECDERVATGDQFDVTPLLALVSYDTPYYLLALAMHHPILYRGDMYGVEQVAIELPESPEIALGIDELHSNSQTVRGYGAHGQGDSKQAGQEERLKYLRLIDDAFLTSKVVDHSLSLLLAGTDDEVSGYREVSRHKHVVDSVLSGNYTSKIAPQDIHARAWPLITEELQDTKRAVELEKVNSLIGTGKASASIEDIAAAAHEGRVDTFLVGMFVTTRDGVSDGNEAVTKLVFSEEYGKKGIGACGRAVFERGGKIVAALKDAMPLAASEAALYRY